MSGGRCQRGKARLLAQGSQRSTATRAQQFTQNAPVLPGDQRVESHEHIGSPCSTGRACALLQQGTLRVNRTPRSSSQEPGGAAISWLPAPIFAEHKQTMRTRLLKSHGFT